MSNQADFAENFGLRSEIQFSLNDLLFQSGSGLNPLSNFINTQLSTVQTLSDTLLTIGFSPTLALIDTSQFIQPVNIPAIITNSVTEFGVANLAQLSNILDNLNVFTQQLTASLSVFDLAIQSLVESNVFADLTHLLETHDRAAEAFNAAGWPIAPSMSSELRTHVVSMHVDGKTRHISRTMLGYYHRRSYHNLRAMVQIWKKHTLFADRMHIIQDAVDAHCEGLYTLSVPALLPQVEGILNDYVLQNNLSARLGKIRQVYEAFVGNPDEYSLTKWIVASTLLYQLQTSTYAYTDFEEELSKSVRRRRTTRHTVLHGVTVNYNKPMHSLKVLVLLDAISALQQLEKR